MQELSDIEYYKLFGKHIKALRKKYDLSQTDLAGKSNLEKTAIQRIERGYNSTIMTLRKLAKGFDISISELFNFPKDDAEK